MMQCSLLRRSLTLSTLTARLPSQLTLTPFTRHFSNDDNSTPSFDKFDRASIVPPRHRPKRFTPNIQIDSQDIAQPHTTDSTLSNSLTPAPLTHDVLPPPPSPRQLGDLSVGFEHRTGRVQRHTWLSDKTKLPKVVITGYGPGHITAFVGEQHPNTQVRQSRPIVEVGGGDNGAFATQSHPLFQAVKAARNELTGKGDKESEAFKQKLLSLRAPSDEPAETDPDAIPPPTYEAWKPKPAKTPFSGSAPSAVAAPEPPKFGSAAAESAVQAAANPTSIQILPELQSTDVDCFGSLVCFPTFVMFYKPRSWEEVTPASLQFLRLLYPRPEFVLFGTGHFTQRVSREMEQFLQEIGMGYEVMDSSNACSTFNMLNDEDRRLVAVIINPSDPKPQPQIAPSAARRRYSERISEALKQQQHTS